MSKLFETLAAELERPRELSARVVSYISGHYGVDDDAVGKFLVDEAPRLEDYEIDLILSPVFTPRLGDQTVFAELLGSESVPRMQWPELVQQLVARPVRAQLVTGDSRIHVVALREVTIERYVHRLRLDGRIPQAVLELINQIPGSDDRPMLKTVARQAVWDNDDVRSILVRYLATAIRNGSYSLEDVLQLLMTVESRKPVSVEDLVGRIPAWLASLQKQIDAAGSPRPFFNEDVRLLHGEGRDQRQQDDLRLSPKQREFEFLERLQRMFSS